MNFIENESAQKLRGGYFTPLDIAIFVSEWVKEISPKNILEPSCGDGVFFEAFSKVMPLDKLNITGFELYKEDAFKARRRLKGPSKFNIKVHAEDYLGWAIKQILSPRLSFDAVVGNPPFIRYQYLPEEFQDKAEKIFKILKLPFTKHTNAWVPFVLSSVELLRPGGRLAMVLPAEIIHIMHAQSLRSYLGSTCSRLLLIDPEEIWFENTLQGAVILLAEKKVKSTDYGYGLGISKVSGKGFLKTDPCNLFNKAPRINGRTILEKWTGALLTNSERHLFQQIIELPEIYKFKDLADVDVGIVTGANKFFLVNDETVRKYNLLNWAYPMFGRSDHCDGVIYDKKQHEHNSRLNIPNNFIWLREEKSKFDKNVNSYIELGEKENLPSRYKCRIRNPWYTVPSVYSTKVAMLKRAHDYHRLILNKLEAFTTDTAYRIKTKSCEPTKIVYCYVNCLTALSAELEGRHYGGGVLELVPSEIEKLIIPYPKKIRPKVRELDGLVRNLNSVELLEKQSNVVLSSLGLTRNDQHQLLTAWLRLKNRRQRAKG